MKTWVGNERLKIKLLMVTVVMFGFGYALVPLYETMCAYLGINVIARGDQNIESTADAQPLNTQVDRSRTLTVEFDSNARGPWFFKPEVSGVQVHPGEITTVMYEFQNIQNRPVTVQAIPSYAPMEAVSNFRKIECFCFRQYTVGPGERKAWPVVFVIDPKISDDVKTITLSYTFFEVGGTTPPAPVAMHGAGGAMELPLKSGA